MNTFDPIRKTIDYIKEVLKEEAPEAIFMYEEETNNRLYFTVTTRPGVLMSKKKQDVDNVIVKVASIPARNSNAYTFEFRNNKSENDFMFYKELLKETDKLPGEK